MRRISPVKIGKRLVGPGYTPYIIFEVASTHQGSWKLAKNYVREAKNIGADAIKFQLYEADKLLNPILSDLKPTYNFFKKSEAQRNWFPKLKKLCDEVGIDLLCTPFDEDAARFLNKLNLPAVKIASGDLTYHNLLKLVAKFEKPVIISTGCATLKEVSSAVSILRKNGCKKIVILQCTSIYPMPYEAANVRVMQTFREKFKTVVGYSDNGSKGILVPLVAVAYGASVIEKHVTSQNRRENMDDIFSLSIKEFSDMIKKIRRKPDLDILKKQFGSKIDLILGSNIKMPATNGIKRAGEKVKMTEIRERIYLRRGIYPKLDIKRGTTISPTMLIPQRPDIGTSVLNWDEIVGKSAAELLPANKPIILNRKKVYHLKIYDAVIVLSAEETEVRGENGDRIKKGINIAYKTGAPYFIFLGTKNHNQKAYKYFKKKNIQIIYPTWKIHASTRTQIYDLSKFLKEEKLANILIISHAYHIPRIKKYCAKLLSNIHYDFWPVGDIKKQKKQYESEMEKIKKYRALGHL